VLHDRFGIIHTTIQFEDAAGCPAPNGCSVQPGAGLS